MQKKYAQLKTLAYIFDISEDFFKNRMGKEFQRGKHYFITPSASKTKKPVVWNIEEIDRWLIENNVSKPDSELNELLSRSG